MRRILVLITTLFLLLPLSALAQDSSAGSGDSFDFTVFANYLDPADGDDNVWGGGLGFGIPVAEAFRVEMRGSWLPDVGSDQLGDLELIPLDLGVAYIIPIGESDFHFGLFGGASYVFADFDAANNVRASVDDDWGWYAGGRVLYDISDSVQFLTNVYYRGVEFDVSSNNDRDFGKYDASGLAIDIGFTF